MKTIKKLGGKNLADFRRLQSKIKYSPFIVDEYIKLYLNYRRKEVEGSEKAFEKKIKPELKDLIADITQVLRGVIAKGNIREVENVRRYQRKVVTKVSSVHKGSVQIFEFLIQLNVSIARECYLRYRKKFSNFDDQLKLDTLIEIHSRASQIAAEILLLVKNGFADGAQARWRSLHELCVTFLFLYDNDIEVLKMYLDYGTIEMYKKITRYAEAHPKLNWKPIPQKEIDAIQNERQLLLRKYGNEFGKDYGWTIKALPTGERHFRGLEQAVSKDDLRGIYCWSSENVHASILGNKNRLGLPIGKQNHLLTGASEYGLFDPMQFTSFSLTEMTQVLLNLENTILNDIKEQMLWGFHKEMVKLLQKENRKLKLRKKRMYQK
jgi:hypothetical protein